ncbi:hypothetical protein FRC19_001485 [Serendipita sp. 401]|nr:hypothetical protein FRC19_001485 [Serendipita sp. 401]
MDIVRFLAVLCKHGQRCFVYPGSLNGMTSEIESPDRWQLPYEHVQLTTSDNVQLKALLFVQRRHVENATDIRTTATSDKEFASRRPTCIVFHGNAEAYYDGVVFARILYLRLRCNVLLASYRGYGDCTGTPSEAGIQIDSQTMLDHVCNHEVLGPSPKMLYGLSLGGAVAIDLASRNPELIHGVAVENTFLSLPKMLPVLMPALGKFKFLVKDKWRSEVNVTKIPASTPLVFLSGALDEIVPPEHMKQLYEISKSSAELSVAAAAGKGEGEEKGVEAKRTFVLFENGHHNDTWTQPTYRKALREFVDSVVIAYREKINHP